jgi:hypothetical protein
MNLAHDSGVWGDCLTEKTEVRKSRETIPLREQVRSTGFYLYFVIICLPSGQAWADSSAFSPSSRVRGGTVSPKACR